jgi:transcriptional regulator with XRE-family HTH domain
MTSPFLPHSFAALLTDGLQRRGINRKDFAGMVKVSRNTVTNWTKGRYRPDHEHTERIAVALGMSIDQLHGRTTRSAQKGSAPRRQQHTPPLPDHEAQRIVRELGALKIDEPLETLRRATPQLLRVLSDAQAYVTRDNRASDRTERRGT